MKVKIISLSFFSILFSISSTHAEQKIPMSDKYYQGKYFLISNIRTGKINTVIYKANFKAETVYSKMEINCSSIKIRATGEGINGIKYIKEFEDKGTWSTPVHESTHSDVVSFVCKI